MKKILITGATGNIGREVIRHLTTLSTDDQLIAGVREVAKAQQIFQTFPKLNFVRFDLEDPQTYSNALEGIDRLFLLRPPHISDVEKYFSPLLSTAKALKIREIVFLSVQGVERSKVIPHHKIEILIKEMGMDYIFIRPSYFMQNLTTTLLVDIKTRRQIILPAGKAKFNWVDIENIGEVAAMLLLQFTSYKNKAYEVTGYENESFYTIERLINEISNHPVKYRSVNPFLFFQIKKKTGMPTGMIMVMTMLHLLPRFQKEPIISHFYEQITGKSPTTLRDFIQRESAQLT
ncbi:NmrA family NAD(P)-binding protein [Reichenbachiella carrageenanivorans]|uniref:NmrA family NAD(P)-binding protein n=1 Tax=Reichenbachiella carrageenanivorans TaxID=2979869 RepID=A0ABY6CWN1_9BACT|nr:NmrA family NAD(P)-binding protein [Reichenbachiella carrageenanivorans]UXX78278.1 NmrA family NAD(P)-binding protein [Reichenbachiella carrageenanivorans]